MSAVAERRGIAPLVERELVDELREVARIERLRQRLDLAHRLAVRARQPRRRQRRLDLLAPGRIVVDPDRNRVPRRLEPLAQAAPGA